MNPQHIISAALCLISAVLTAIYGGLAPGVIFFTSVLYFNIVAIDVQLARHRVFKEPHPGKRIIGWLIVCTVCSVAGYIVRLALI